MEPVFLSCTACFEVLARINPDFLQTGNVYRPVKNLILPGFFVNSISILSRKWRDGVNALPRPDNLIEFPIKT
jgi:hypothetical protein